MAALVSMQHSELGVVVELPDTDHWRGLGWSPVDAPLTADVAGQFNPAEHNVEEVVAHLAASTEEERARVLSAEQAGKARSTVLGWTPSPAA